MAPQLMWIGVGEIGSGMCRNLAVNGNLDKPLIIYNRTPKRAEDLANQLPPGKVQVVTNLEEGLHKADIVLSCLANDGAVKAVFESILQNDIGGKLFVECSTIAPETTEQTAHQVTARGAEYVASPVFGRAAAARAGHLLFVTAGPKASIDKLRPFIKGVMGVSEIAFEDKPYGSSLKLKLIGNTFVFVLITALAEAFTMAEKSGIDAGLLKQFIDNFISTNYIPHGDRMIQGTYWKTEDNHNLLSINILRKDTAHALDLAESVGVDLKLTPIVGEYLKGLAEHIQGDSGDITGIYGVARKNAGLKYENDA